MKFNKFTSTFDLFRKEINSRIYKNEQLFHMSMERALESGEVVGPCRFKAETGEIQVASFHYKARKGDRLNICIFEGKRFIPICEDPFTIDNLQVVKLGTITFKFVEVNVLKACLIDHNLDYFLLPHYNPMFDRMLAKKLRNIEKFKEKTQINVKHEMNFYQGLNLTQISAIESILKNKFAGVIQGPPGTGKTEVLARLVEIAVANNLKVAVLSFTNKAVDNALARISRTIKEGVVRVFGSVDSKLDEEVEIVGRLSGIKNFRVLGTTTHKFLFSSSYPQIDVIILDEASQIPSYFLPGLKSVCGNIVMIGDQHQLPPVIQTNQRSGSHVDCFSFYIEEQKNLPMLNTQYRMNHFIQEWSSNRYYEGKLHAHIGNARRDVFESKKHEIFRENVIKHDHNYSGTERIANQVIEYVKEAKKTSGIKWDDIGIISPHRVHASQVNRKIQESFGPEVNEILFADTVDRFQGQEKELIIFTMASENSDQSEFINDYRRINVAVTRSKSRFYAITDYNHRQDGELSAFLKWCETRSDMIPKNTRRKII